VGRSWYTRHGFEGAAIVVSAILIFTNLGGMYLWQDEAETALLSMNTLRYGYPRVWDGKNLVTQAAKGRFYNREYVQIEHPWLPYYLTAASFWAFGASPFTARLASALVGLFAVFLLYRVSRLMFGEEIAIIATLSLVFSVVFLLFVRQSRQYGFMIFATIWWVYAYWGMRRQRRFALAHLVGSGAMMFHCLFTLFFTIALGTALHFLLFAFDRRLLKTLVVGAGLIGLITVPWAWYTGMVGRYLPVTRSQALYSFKDYVTNINLYLFPLWLPLVTIPSWGRRGSTIWWVVGSTAYIGLITAFVWPSAATYSITLGIVLAVTVGGLVLLHPHRKNEHANFAALCILMVMTTVLCLAFLSAYRFFRYLVPFIPVFAVLIGLIIARLRVRSAPLAYSLFGVLLFTNVGGIAPYAFVRHLPFRAEHLAPVASLFSAALGQDVHRVTTVEHIALRLRETDNAIRATPQVQVPLWEYLYELTHEYNGPIEGICRYLVAHARPTDLVMVNYEDLPIMFHTGMRVVGFLQPLPPDPAPDWVIIRRDPPWDREYYERISRGYERIVIDYPDIPWENMPDPRYHKFRTVQNADRVVVLKKPSAW